MKPARSQFRSDQPARWAFSMLEMVVVVLVTGVLASIVVPRYGNFIARQHIDAAAERITLDLALAQRQARFTSTQHKVTFKSETNSYRILVWDKANISWDDVPSMTQTNQAYVVDLLKEPYNATLVAADFGGDQEVVFDGYGTPDSGGTVTVNAGRYATTLTFGTETFSVTPVLVEGAAVEATE